MRGPTLPSTTQELVAHGAGLWSVTSELRVAPGFILPIRATLLRTRDGLVLISPIEFQEHVAAQIDELGDVTTVIAPNLLHHLFLARALERWPGARCLAPTALRRKQPSVKIAGEPREIDSDDVAALPIEGTPFIDETLFLHRPSSALIATDLLFNVRQPRGLLTGLVLRAVRAHGSPGHGVEWWWLARDRPAFQRSLQMIGEWQFDQLIPAHGEPLTANAKPRVLAELRRAAGSPPGW